jgi:membrane-associated phospholipid phosphatase
LWAAAAFLFVALAVDRLAGAVQAVDDRIWDLAVAWEWRPAVVIAVGLDVLGSRWVTLPLRAAVAAWLGVRRRWEAFWFWGATAALSEVFIGPMKLLYARPRPPDALVDTSGYSFPSGHAVAGASIAVGLVIALVPAGPRRRNLEILAGLFAVAMGLSRVYLRAHWLSDVFAGVALGAAVAVTTAAAVHRIATRRASDPGRG